MKKSAILLLVYWLHFFFPAIVSPDSPPDRGIKIERVVAENKMSSNSILCILQDYRGYIWIGAQGGLSRFDGYHYSSFHHIPGDPRTLSDNYILAICQSRDGKMWIGTLDGGLNMMEADGYSFSHFRHNPRENWSISSDYISSILEDRAGRLWIGTNYGGLNRMERETGRFLSRQALAECGHYIPCSDVTSLLEDNEGNIWVGSMSEGLFRLNPATGKVTEFLSDAKTPGALLNNSIWNLFEDRDGAIWAGVTGGICRFDPQRNCFINFPLELQEVSSQSYRLISGIAEDNQGRLWLGTGSINHLGRGVLVMDKKTGTITNLPSLDENPTLSPISVNTIYRDRGGMMWFGTTDDGLFKYNPDQPGITVIKNERGNPGSLSENQVWGICEDRRGRLLIGVKGGGLNLLERKTMTFKHFLHDPRNPHSLRDDTVRAVVQDHEGLVWVGTDTGLDQLDLETGRFTHCQIAANESDPKTSGAYTISCLYEDQNKNFWVGVWGNGLHLYHRGKKKFLPRNATTDDPNGLNQGKITFIFMDSRGVLWLGAYATGLLRMLDPEKGAFSEFPKTPENHDQFNASPSLNKITLNCILETRPDTFWLGSRNSGMYKFNPATGDIIRFYLPYGPGSNCIYGILNDSRGNLWMSTNNGIFRFDPATGIFTRYATGNRQKSDEFNQGAWYKNAAGEIFFGGINGLSCFNPDFLMQNKNIPPIVITDIRIFGESITRYPNNQRLSSQQSGAIKLRLNHWENHFSFEFAALEYTNPPNNRYAYKMEGFDREWIQSDTRRFANYTNLDGGNYVFRVVGSNNDGVWNHQGVSVYISITPPFWKTLWFQLLIFSLLCGLTILIFIKHTEKLRREIVRHELHRKELQQSRDALKEANDIIQYRHDEVLKIISAISSILIACDARGRITQWNETAEKFFGLPRNHVMGENILTLLSPFIREEVLTAIHTTGTTRRAPEILNVTVNSWLRTRVLEIYINPITENRNAANDDSPGENSGGNNDLNPGYLLLMEDATDRRAEEAQKNVLLKLKSIGQLQMGISHEINTPLQYIRINSTILSGLLEQWRQAAASRKPRRNGNPGEETISLGKTEFETALKKGRTALQTIEEGLANITRITRAMKEFFYPGGEKMEMADINELITSTLIVSNYKLRKAAEIETTLSGMLPRIPCYPARLNLVFQNLLTNAADAVLATGKHGKISISSVLENNEIIIRVCDSGIGIPAEHKEKIFTPCFTTKSIGIGTGLGLSMSKKIIEENHCGNLRFQSALGTGTEFTVHLPLSPKDIHTPDASDIQKIRR